MKNFVLSCLGLALLSLAAVGLLDVKKYGMPAFGAPALGVGSGVLTAYGVTHPSIAPGVQVTIKLSGGNTWVHFPLDSPCDVHDLQANQPGGVATCVAALGKPLPPYAAQYPFSMDKISTTPPSTEGKCRSCCYMCQVAYPKLNAGYRETNSATKGSGPLPADEILIDQSDKALFATDVDISTVVSGRTVKWFRSGPGIQGWTVNFTGGSPCKDTTAIGSDTHKQTKICTIKDSASGKYNYTMDSNGMTGTGVLDVTQ